MAIDLAKSDALRAAFAARVIGKKPKITCPACSKSQSKCCDKHEKKRCKACKNFITDAHMHIDYLGHAHVTERLLDVDPDWDWDALAYNPSTGLPQFDESGGLWIRLTVCGKSRIGYGGADGKRGDDAVKETIGDAIKNAAMRFGVGLALWMREGAAPVDDVPAREVERPAQTPEDRKTELRGQIAAVGRKRGWKVEETADEFAAWTGGKLDIRHAGVAVLAEFLDHLQRQDDST